VKARLDTIVVSYGGSGSTFLLEFLRQHLRVNASNSWHDGIKHINSPNHPILELYEVRRAVYLYGDPRAALVSLYRRNFQVHVIPKVNAMHRSVAEYAEYVAKTPMNLTFDEFLENGRDLLNCTRHLLNWLTERTDFPLMYVKYEHLLEHIGELLTFLDLPSSLAVEFPASMKRATALENLTEAQRRKLSSIYGEFLKLFEALPPVMIRGPREDLAESLVLRETSAF
jgi:hypothetical protein